MWVRQGNGFTNSPHIEINETSMHSCVLALLELIYSQTYFNQKNIDHTHIFVKT